MALREILAHFGFSVDDSKLKKANASIDGVASKMRAAMGVFAAGAIVGAVRGFVDEMHGLEASIKDTSNQLGVSTHDLQAWQLAAKLSGAESADLVAGFRNLSKNAAEASKAGDFKKLGVDVKDVGGQLKEPAQLMREVGLAVGAIKNPTERTAKALELFGKSGTKLTPIFTEGAGGLDALLGRLDELGGGVGDDALEVLGKSGDAADELGIAVTSLKARLAVALFPALRDGIGWLTRTIASIAKGAKGTKIFQAAVLVMSTAVIGALVSMYAGFLPILLVIAAAILIVEDLWTAWEGGDSLIGRVIDSIFGIGTTQETIAKVKKTWESVNAELERTPGLANKARAVFDMAADSAQESGVDTLDAFRDLYDALRSDEASWSDIGKSWVWALVAPFADLGAFLWPHFRDGTNAVWKAFDDWATRGFKVAVDFVVGIAQGIASGAGQVYEAVAGLASGVLKKLKEVWDSHSPSRAAALEAGNVPEGMVVGMQRYRGEVSRASEDLGDQAMAGIVAMRPQFALSPGQQATARATSAAPTMINVDASTNARIEIAGSESRGVRADVARGLGDAQRNQREALLADLETVMVPS